MKVELENIVLGHSELSDEIFAGIPQKGKPMWKHKKSVTNDFIACVISRWNGFRERITDSQGKTYEIQVKEIKK